RSFSSGLQVTLPGIEVEVVPPLTTAVIDPLLSEVLQALQPGQLVEAVLTFHSAPTLVDLAAIQATGVQLVPFKALPMVGVRGTASQILMLYSLPGLRSVYYNRQLSYFLDESIPLIGANRVWNDLGVTGEGVAVAILDSGIDASHPDLPFGEKVIQNVKVAPDLFGTGPLVLENLANTDTSSGHGTHVASTAAGTGAALSGKYRGVAVGADLVGASAPGRRCSSWQPWKAWTGSFDTTEPMAFA
ncbi:MAG: S8 family serine peptidase, partial [Nitrospirales bacterium]